MTDNLTAAVDGLRGDLDRVVRQRTRWYLTITLVLVLAFAGAATAGFLWNRAVFCSFFTDLQPPPDQAAPVGDYGKRILTDAQNAANRMHC